jgi:hypothetical protein
MKILAVVDVHPLAGGRTRGLFARISKQGGGHFDLPISREQAGLLLENVESLIEPTATPESPEEENLFSEFATDMRMAVGDSPHHYEEEDDDL